MTLIPIVVHHSTNQISCFLPIPSQSVAYPLRSPSTPPKHHHRIYQPPTNPPLHPAIIIAHLELLIIPPAPSITLPPSILSLTHPNLPNSPSSNHHPYPNPRNPEHVVEPRGNKSRKSKNKKQAGRLGMIFESSSDASDIGSVALSYGCWIQTAVLYIMLGQMCQCALQ